MFDTLKSATNITSIPYLTKYPVLLITHGSNAVQKQQGKLFQYSISQIKRIYEML